MELRRLKYFMRVAELGSLTRASVALRVAQPALSRQMHLLQDELGITLFRRVLRGLELTEAGEHLFAAISAPMRELEQAIKDASTFACRLEGDLAIAMPSNVAEFLALPFIEHMGIEHPNIKLRIMEGPTGLIFDWLNRGLNDFVLLEEPLHDERHDFFELISEPLLLVGPAGSGLRPGQAMTLAQVAPLPLILSSHVFGIRGVINEAAARSGIKLNVRFEADSSKLTRDLIVKGLGYAILPLSNFRVDHERGLLEHCPIIEPEMASTITLTWRKDSKAGQIFFKPLVEMFRKATDETARAKKPRARKIAA